MTQLMAHLGITSTPGDGVSEQLGEIIEEKEQDQAGLSAQAYFSPYTLRKRTNNKQRTTPKRKRESSSFDDECRVRTPSGQVLTPKVGIITNYFEVKCLCRINEHDEVIQKCAKCKQVNSQGDNANTSSDVTIKTRLVEQMPKQPVFEDKESEGTQAENSKQTPDNQSDSMANLLTPTTIGASLEKIFESHIKDAEKEGANFNVNSSAMEDSENPNPAVMSVESVVKLFRSLKHEMLTEIGKVKLIESSNTKCNENLAEAEKSLAFQEKSITELQNQQSRTLMNDKFLAENGVRCKDIIQELQDRIDRLEINNAKRMVTISGFYCSDKKKIYIQQLYDFFQKELGVKVYIEEAYKSGSSSPPSLIVTLQSVKEKKSIFQNISNIKDLVNKDGKKIFINDYRTPAQLSKRSREKEIREEMSTRQPAQKKEIVFSKGSIQIDGEPYVRKIKVPDTSELVLMTDEELQRVMQVKITQGPSISKQNSKFLCYTMPANNFQDVEVGYMKTKMDHPGARHVAAVWILPGIQKQEVEDYQEDDEFGLGKIILQRLKKSEVMSRAVFLVRYYGGQKMGADRFECYIRAMELALERAPENSITRKKDILNSDVSKRNASTNSGRGRGGGGRGGNRGGGRGGKTPPNSKKSDEVQQKRTFVPKDEALIEQEYQTKTKSYAGALAMDLN